MEPITVEEADTSALEVGDTRTHVLRYMRLDVEDFEQTLSLQDLRELPAGITERLWLLDLDLIGGPAAPRLIDSALAAIRALHTDELPPAEQNMQRLLEMTAEDADLSGTVLEPMSELGSLVGLPSARILSDMVGSEVDAPYLPDDVVTRSIVRNIVSSHPAAQTRRGPITPENPDGIYLVAPGAIPITLADAINDFTSLSVKFGPVSEGGVVHPGFVVGATEARVLGDEFSMTVRANANALPFKGLDLTNVSSGSVSSLGGQIGTLFDFDDPSWLTITGLPEAPTVIDTLTFEVQEHDGFIDGGRSPEPLGQGDSPIWRMAPWTLESLVASAAQDAFQSHNFEASYFLPNDPDNPVFEVVIVDGWVEFFSQGDVGEPPAPAYLWDVILEIAQTRLHDQGIEEGDANVAFTLNDVEVGITSREVDATLRANIEADPIAFLDLAEELLDTATGAPDFFYVRALSDDLDHPDSDWLFFVNEADIPLGRNGEPERLYGYDSPGFFLDAMLTLPASSTEEAVGDTSHHKVEVVAGDRLYIGDDSGAVFELAVSAKPSLFTISLDVTRVR
ncbi:MAG: hypothetical protein ACJAYU_001529 [Bradymonadia bacterium]|jgi:hypothetical protein